MTCDFRHWLPCNGNHLVVARGPGRYVSDVCGEAEVAEEPTRQGLASPA